jgi:hypothetical protein
MKPLSRILFLLAACGMLIFLATSEIQAQEVDEKILKQVRKMCSSELKKLYADPLMITQIKDIRTTLKPTENTREQWSEHQNVDLNQVSFDVEVRYNKIIDPNRGEIGSYREILRCVLGKYRSVRWNRLSLYRNDCQDCEGETLFVLKTAINPNYSSD